LTTVGAIYNFGFASIGAGYQSEKANGTSVNVAGTTSALQFTKAEGFALTALVPLGAFTPYIKYGERKYSGGSFGTFTPTKMTNVGVRYALSKRTYVYATYARVANSGGAATVVGGGAVTAANQSSTGTEVGLRVGF
jgi:predicted porin